MAEKESSSQGNNRAKQLLLAVLFGLAFGWLLQKSGVAKYHILMGVLLLQDFTVIKVMVTAIIVGMAGLFILNAAGLVELKSKETVYGANIIGGLVFGAGFALSGYCPGTGAAALGQMNYDALFMITGMVVGSYLYAEASNSLGRMVKKWGQRGKLLIPEVLGLPRTVTVVGAIVLLVAGLILLERYD